MNALVLGFALSAALHASPEENWPQWRGPTNDSVVHGKPLPVEFGPEKNVVWKVKFPGWGNSTPVIWDDAIFLTSQDGDALLALRLDRKSGDVVWKKELGKGSPRRSGPVGNLRFHDETNMAAASPITDGKQVWWHFGNGDLTCTDFDGKTLWQENLMKNYGPYSIWWGHSNSPVLVGDLLVNVCIQDPKGGGKSYVVALDKNTGKECWFADRTTGAKEEPADSYTTPLLHQENGKTQIIVYGGNVLDAYDPADGKRLWQAKPFNGNRVIAGPTLSNGVVYAVQGMKGPLFAVKAGGEGDVTKTNTLWNYKGSTPDAATPAVVGDLVFLATNQGAVVCVDAKDGKEIWKERLGETFRATPLVSGNKLYLFSKEGVGTVLEASREFKTLHRVEFGEQIIASPAAAQGELYVRTKGHLYRFGAK